MVVRDEVIKKLENERDLASMRAFHEDQIPSNESSDYLFGYFLGFANGLNAAIEQIRPTTTKGKGRRKREKAEKNTILRLI